MYIVLADDKKHVYLLPAAEKLFTREYSEKYLFVFEYLRDAIKLIEELDYVDIGIFDIDFNPEGETSRLHYTPDGQRPYAITRNDHITKLMGVNLLIASVGKAKKNGGHFIGSLYTFREKDLLRSQSLDMRIFIDYQLPQWDDLVDIWQASDAEFVESIAQKIKNMLREVRKKYSPLIENYTEFKATVERFRNQLDQDINSGEPLDKQLIQREDVERRLKEIKESLRFKPDSRPFTFETFFPEFDLELNQIIEYNKREDGYFGVLEKQRIYQALSGLVLDWKPYTSILTRLLRQLGDGRLAGAYDNKCHNRDLSEQDEATVARVAEFAMLPPKVIEDLNNGNCSKYRLNGLLSLIDEKIKDLQRSIQDNKKRGLYLNVNSNKFEIEAFGDKHSITIEYPVSTDLNDVHLCFDLEGFYNCFLSLFEGEIIKHGFGRVPDGCERIKEKKVFIGFQQTRSMSQDKQDYHEYILAVGDNGYGFSGGHFNVRGNLESIKEYASAWCEEMHIETHYRKDGTRFKYDVFNERVMEILQPSPELKETSGTVYHFIFRVRDYAV